MTYLIAALILIIMFEMLLTFFVIVHIMGLRQEMDDLDRNYIDWETQRRIQNGLQQSKKSR